MHPPFRPLCSTYSLGGLSLVSYTTEDYKTSHSWAGNLHCLHVFCVFATHAPKDVSNPVNRKHFCIAEEIIIHFHSLYPFIQK